MSWGKLVAATGGATGRGASRSPSPSISGWSDLVGTLAGASHDPHPEVSSKAPASSHLGGAIAPASAGSRRGHKRKDKAAEEPDSTDTAKKPDSGPSAGKAPHWTATRVPRPDGTILKPGPKPGCQGRPNPYKGRPRPKFKIGPDGEQVKIQYGRRVGTKLAPRPDFVSRTMGKKLPQFKTGPDGEQIKIKYGRPKKAAGSSSGPADDGKPE